MAEFEENVKLQRRLQIMCLYSSYFLFLVNFSEEKRNFGKKKLGVMETTKLMEGHKI